MPHIKHNPQSMSSPTCETMTLNMVYGAMRHFPEQLSELRKQKRMSQAELGDLLGVSRAAVSEWEKGKSIPRLDKLAEISRFFGISLAELSGTPGDDMSVDAELRRLPEDMQHILRKSFMDTIASLIPPKKP